MTIVFLRTPATGLDIIATGNDWSVRKLNEILPRINAAPTRATSYNAARKQGIKVKTIAISIRATHKLRIVRAASKLTNQ
jgi:hypothetical protein